MPGSLWESRSGPRSASGDRFDGLLSRCLPGRWHHPYRVVAHPELGYAEALKVLRSQERIKRLTGVSAIIDGLAFLRTIVRPRGERILIHE